MKKIIFSVAYLIRDYKYWKSVAYLRFMLTLDESNFNYIWTCFWCVYDLFNPHLFILNYDPFIFRGSKEWQWKNFRRLFSLWWSIHIPLYKLWIQQRKFQQIVSTVWIHCFKKRRKCQKMHQKTYQEQETDVKNQTTSPYQITVLFFHGGSKWSLNRI